MKKSVANLTLSRASNGKAYLTIEDYHSGDRLLEITMSLSDLGALVSGAGEVATLMEYYEDCTIGKDREVLRVSCNKVDRKSQKDEVQSDFESNWESDGWDLLHDGTASQQNSKVHNYSICRYNDISEDEFLKPLKRNRFK
ncbi:hypothetical protein NVP1121O_151 [Vibrio phage 1.121.O._10N.286.46.C4]|nr:hypothetical protein NVP1121O_151 [Vibrio phage 1.121.O._10N.286.46.C4]